jgi:nitrate reductase NapE component
MNQTRGDALVAEYLDRVRAAAAGLDPGRREELIQDLREHIATARAELTTETEADVRAILDRLGDPTAIAAEAAVGEPVRPPVAPPPPGYAAPPKSSKTLITVLVAVLAVFVLVPVALCVLGGLGFVAVQTTEIHGPTEIHRTAVEIPLPTMRPSARPNPQPELTADPGQS